MLASLAKLAVYLLAGFPIIALTACAPIHSDSSTPLIARYNFSNQLQLEDWIAEGPAEVSIAAGRLYLESEFRLPVQGALTDQQIRAGNGTDESIYRHVLVPLLAKRKPDALKDYKAGDPIRYGHAVLWNKHPLPANFIIEYDFRAEAPYPLHLVHFSAAASDGGSIFADGMAPRTGVAREYMYGDLSTYRISYFSGSHNSVNMRKAPGRNLAASQSPDPSAEQYGQIMRAKIVKRGGSIRFYINGKRALQHIDPQPLGAGRWGFRVMLLAKASYDNIRIYGLND